MEHSGVQMCVLENFHYYTIFVHPVKSVASDFENIEVNLLLRTILSLS